MVHGHVHLPGQVVREVVLVRRVPHGELVKPAVAQANGGGGGHDLERGVLGLVGEQPSFLELGASHVLHALGHVGGSRVLKEREGRCDVSTRGQGFGPLRTTELWEME